MKEKYLFLYVKTGGGHLAPAKSIAAYLRKNHGDAIEPILVDGLEQTPPWIRKSIEEGYRHLQSKAKWLYGIIYELNKLPPIAKVNNSIVSRSVTPFIQAIILNERPTRIVLFHFFLIKPVLGILERNGLNIPVITVVTDPFTVHPVWFYRKEPYFVVFSKRVKEYSISRGISSDRIAIFPFVVDERYGSHIDQQGRERLKEKFGFHLSKKIVLIIGGGDGIPRGKAILRHILDTNSSADVAIVCGRNRSLYRAATQLKVKSGLSNLKIFGYVDFVYELLNISDVVVTKCGASTFMQILLSKKVPIVNSYLWEQEKGTVEFLKESGVGIYENNVRKLPTIVERLITDPDFYSSYQRNIERLALENGTKRVSEFLVNFQSS